MVESGLENPMVPSVAKGFYGVPVVSARAVNAPAAQQEQNEVVGVNTNVSSSSSTSSAVNSSSSASISDSDSAIASVRML